MADDKTKDTSNEDDKKEELTPTNLEEVHDKTLRDLEDNPNDDENEEEQEAEDDKKKVDEDPKDKEDDKKEEGSGDKEEDAPAEPVKEPEPVAVPPEKVDPNEGKVAVKDADGETHYFSTVDEIPDDFEPASYKALSVATRDLTNLENKVAADEAKAKEDQAAEEHTKRIDALQAQWNKETQALIDSGDIPKDDAEGKKVVDAVYALMADEMAEGHNIATFTHAFELYEYRNSKSDDKAKINAEKKKRGGMVQSGGSAAPVKPSSSNKSYEAPPTGVTLDQVHEKILGSL